MLYWFGENVLFMTYYSTYEQIQRSNNIQEGNFKMQQKF